jgi:hypothetical protein
MNAPQKPLPGASLREKWLYLAAMCGYFETLVPYETEPIDCYDWEEMKNRMARQEIERELQARTDEALLLLFAKQRWPHASQGVAWCATRRLEFGKALAESLAQPHRQSEDAFLPLPEVRIGDFLEWLTMDAWTTRSNLLGLRLDDPHRF